MADLLSGDDWEEDLITAHGHPTACLANVALILRAHPAWAGVIAYDESRGEIVMAEPGPTARVVEGQAWQSRPWTDSDDTATTVWLQRHDVRAKATDVAAAVGLIASDHHINPLVAYLRSLQWDGTPRLDRWLATYVGAEDNVYARAVGATWLRGAVGRAIAPGIKLDGALILEGLQGKGKSSVLGILGGEWFTDDIRDLDSKDAAQQIGCAWIVELAELSAMGRSQVEATKAFITRRVDKFRPPYGRRVISAPRRCAFAGSTNRDEYFADPTGNRRFWPVVAGAVDLDGLRRDRDQLLAEAVATWSGGDVVLPEAAWGLAAEQQEQRYQADSWEATIAHWLVGQTGTVSVPEVLKGALEIDPARQGRSEQTRCGIALRRLGWFAREHVLPGTTKRERRYERPPPDKVAEVVGEVGKPSQAAPTTSTTSRDLLDETLPVSLANKSCLGGCGGCGGCGGREKQGNATSPATSATFGASARSEWVATFLRSGYSLANAERLADEQAAVPCPSPPGVGGAP